MNGADVSYTAVAVSDSPLGPFPNSKALITNEEFGSNAIDQFYYEENGKKYMFFGSFKGIYVTELTDDGLSVKRDAKGKPVLKKQICGNLLRELISIKRMAIITYLLLLVIVVMVLIAVIK